jgi:hypothetical protein
MTIAFVLFVLIFACSLFGMIETVKQDTGVLWIPFLLLVFLSLWGLIVSGLILIIGFPK